MKGTLRRRMGDRLLTALAGVCAGLTLLPLVAILIYIGIRGFRRLNLTLFTQLPPPPGLEQGGVANAIVGTAIVVGLATVISVPLGILAGIYLSEFGATHRATRWIRLATNVLSGVPSILAGVFAYGLLVATGILGFSAASGGVALAVLMVPAIVRTTEDALQLVPQDLRWASLGVGASPVQTVVRIVLPAALPGVTTGILLAIARAAGETAPLIFTALSSSLFSTALKQPIATLSVLIYNFSNAPFAPQQDLAWAASLLLVSLVLVTSVLARWATRRNAKG